MADTPIPQQINEAKTSAEAAGFLYDLGFTSIQVVGKNPAFGEGVKWQQRTYTTRDEAVKHFEGWDGTKPVPHETEKGKIVERSKNIGVLSTGFIFFGPNTQEALDAMKAEMPFYDETLCRVGNNPYPGAIFKCIDDGEAFWSGQKIQTNDDKLRTMADIWGNGNQFVVWGVHPSGVHYRFTNNCPILSMQASTAKKLCEKIVARMGSGYRLKTEKKEKNVVVGTEDKSKSGFAKVKRAVRIKEYLGITENRIMCPLHKQGSSNPAAVIYENPDGDSVYCHSCGQYADVIALHAKLTGIKPVEAMVALAEKYDVDIPKYIPKEKANGDDEHFIGFDGEPIAVCKNSLRDMQAEFIARIVALKEDMKSKDAKVVAIATAKIERINSEFFHRIVPDIYCKLFPSAHFFETKETISFDGKKWGDCETLVNGWLEVHSSGNENFKFKVGQKREVFVHVRDKSQMSISDWKEAPPYLVPFKNGMLDVRTLTLRPQVASDRIRLTLAVDWNPDAKCEKIVKYINDVSTKVKPDGVSLERDTWGEPLIDEIMRKNLLQLIGYLMYRGYPIQKIFLLLGVGGNGKGVFQYLIHTLIGPLGYSACSFNEMSDDRFATADIYGKFANIASELSREKIENTDIPKKLSGGDAVRAQFKNAQPFTYINSAKLINALNELPESADKSGGWYRRIFPIYFRRLFEGVNDNQNLKEELKLEIEGLAVLGIMELKEWIGEDGSWKLGSSFAGTKTIKEIETLYNLEVDSLSAFIESECETPELLPGQTPLDVWTASSVLFTKYIDFCSNKKVLVPSEKMCGVRFKDRFVRKQKSVGGERQWGFCGITMAIGI